MNIVSFPFNTREAFHSIQEERFAAGKRKTKLYHSWIRGPICALELICGVDYVFVLEPRVVGKTGVVQKTMWATAEAGERIIAYAKTRGRFHSNYSNATKKWEAVFESGLHKCNECKKALPIHWFRESYGRPYRRLQGKCIKCDDARAARLRTEASSSVAGSLAQRWTGLKSGATRRGIVFDIDVDLLIELWDSQKGLCYYTGVPMAYKRVSLPGIRGHKNPYIVSVDRVDPKKGYTRGNVVLCLWIVNFMKSDLSLKKFKAIITAVQEHMGW